MFEKIWEEKRCLCPWYNDDIDHDTQEGTMYCKAVPFKVESEGEDECTFDKCPILFWFIELKAGGLFVMEDNSVLYDRLIKQSAVALKDAWDHLDYCGYGDSWERGCAKEQGLAIQIAAAIEAYNKITGNKL